MLDTIEEYIADYSDITEVDRQQIGPYIAIIIERTDYTPAWDPKRNFDIRMFNIVGSQQVFDSATEWYREGDVRAFFKALPQVWAAHIVAGGEISELAGRLWLLHQEMLHDTCAG